MKILMFSNSIQGKWGYSMIAAPVAKILQNAGHQVYYLGMQSIHPQYKGADGIIYCGLKHDLYGRDIVPDLIQAYGIDCFFSMHDLWVDPSRWMLDLPKMFPRLAWVHHVTINSVPISPVLQGCFSVPNVLVAPSKFNFEELNKGGLGNRSVYIPHAVDTKIFKKLSENEVLETRKRLRLEDKQFIVVCVQKNKGMQKGFPALFTAWKLFLDKHQELNGGKAALVLLTDPTSFEGVNMEMMRARALLTESIHFIWTKEDDQAKNIMTFEADPKGFRHNTNYGIEQEEVCKLFNIANCSIVPSKGESFCLPAVESMACGTPVIMADFATGPELIKVSGAGLLAKVSSTETTTLISDIAVIDEESMAECIEKFYLDTKFRVECSINGIKFVNNNYVWDKVAPQWVDLFKKVDGKIKELNYSIGNLGV